MPVMFKLLVLTIVALGIVFICSILFFKRMLSDIDFFTNFSRPFYDFFYTRKNIAHLRTNNFGYAPIDEEIACYEPDLRYGLQLYKEMAKDNAGYLISKEDIVAEISCGKGAGAEYLVKKYMPYRYTGVDFSGKAIGFCNNYYRSIKNLEFIRADCLHLPFADQSLNIVINVEASHLYRDTPKFFAEVHRVLKENGRFLFADYRCVGRCPIEKLEQEITAGGLLITRKQVVTSHILAACKQASQRRKELVKQAVPRFLHKYFRHYAVLEGSKKFNMMKNGEIIYMMYHIIKPGLLKEPRILPVANKKLNNYI